MQLRRILRSSILAFSIAVFMAPDVTAQQMPADVQQIMQKMQSGQKPTAEEMQRLCAWGNSMEKQGSAASTAAKTGSRAPAAAGKSGNFSQSGASSLSPMSLVPAETKSESAANGAQTLPCPPKLAKAVATVAPTSSEFLALVRSIAATYGARIGAGRTPIDTTLAGMPANSSSTGVGATLFMSGAAAASVYLHAAALLKNPADLDAANNPGVALDAIPDPMASSRVLIYVHKMEPQVALTSINLGWTYFNSGNASLAQKQFSSAVLAGPDLAGGYNGLGLLAACRNDQFTAQAEFRKALNRSYSGIAALGYSKARQAEEKSESDSTEDSLPPDDSATERVPELPADVDTQRTEASQQTFQHAYDFADERIQRLYDQLQEARSRLEAVARHFRTNPDGSIDFPRVFDKQLLQYRDILRLTLGYSMSQAGQQIAPDSQSTSERMVGVAQSAGEDVQNSIRLQNRLNELAQHYSDCLWAGGDDKVCKPPYEREAASLQQQAEEVAYLACTKAKQELSDSYGLQYRSWKKFSDALRSSSRDLYAYSQPVIDSVWLPALHDAMDAERELAVLTLYKHEAGMALSMADNERGYADLKCVPPRPPAAPQPAKNPKLNGKGIDCPLNPPAKIGLAGVSMTLGCETFSVEDGDGLAALMKFEKERAVLDNDYTADMQKFAKAAGSRYIVSVRVTESDSQAYMQIKLLDADSASALEMKDSLADKGDMALDAAEKLAGDFVMAINLPAMGYKSSSGCDSIPNPWTGTIIYSYALNMPIRHDTFFSPWHLEKRRYTIAQLENTMVQRRNAGYTIEQVGPVRVTFGDKVESHDLQEWNWTAYCAGSMIAPRDRRDGHASVVKTMTVDRQPDNRDATVSIRAIASGKIRITADFPPVKETVTQTLEIKDSGGCPGEEPVGQNDRKATTVRRDNLGQLRWEVPSGPTSDHLAGEEKRQIDSMTETIRWDLQRASKAAAKHR